MSVYVNKLRTRYGGLSLCHLLADSPSELHEMAAILGLEPSLFQADKIPHYDLSLAKRDQAIAAGALVIDRAQLALLMVKYRPGS
jgi:hypothetical protein